MENKQIADVENCKSYVNITAKSIEAHNYIFVGGIIGEPGSICFNNCINYGSINIKPGGNSEVGGISSSLHWEDAWIKNSINYGEIVVNCTESIENEENYVRRYSRLP